MSAREITKSWMLLPVTRELAERLIVYETVEGERSELAGLAVVRVYDKLRRPLCALAGVAGFQSLASRALVLAQSEAPRLSTAQVTADGYLQWNAERDSKLDDQDGRDQEVILIAQLLGLLLTFIGEALTLRILLDVWPESVLDDGIQGQGEAHESTR
jgi:hypothetical protein